MTIFGMWLSGSTVFGLGCSVGKRAIVAGLGALFGALLATIPTEVTASLPPSFSAQQSNNLQDMSARAQPLSPGQELTRPTAPLSTGAPTTEIWPGSVSYNRRPEFQTPYVQKDLTLGMEYAYQFNIFLRARSEKITESSVPDGWYKLDLAVVLPDVNFSALKSLIGSHPISPYDRFVTSRSIVVAVTGGMLSREIRLRFPSITATTVASHLFVQLAPLEKFCPTRGKPDTLCVKMLPDGRPDLRLSTLRPKSNFKPILLDLTFVPYLPSGTGTSGGAGVPRSPKPDTDADLSEYIARAKSHHAELFKRRNGGGQNALSYAASNKLSLVNLTDPIFDALDGRWAKGQSAAGELKKLISRRGTGPLQLTRADLRLFPVLCMVWANRNIKTTHAESASPEGNLERAMQIPNISQLCSANLQKTMRFSLVEHIYSFDATKTLVTLNQPMRYNVSTNFMVNRSQSVDTLKSWNVFEPLLKIADLTGLGVFLRATGLGYSLSISNGRNTSENSGGWMATSLDLNLLQMEIPVLSSQRCLEMRILPTEASPLYQLAAAETKNGVYICDEISNTPHKVNEMYSHIFVRAGDTSTADPYSPNVQFLNVSLQGDRDLSTFFYLIRGAMTPNHNNEVHPFEFLENAAAYFHGTPSSGSGTIVNPLLYPKEESPSFMNRVLGLYSEEFDGRE